MLARGGERVSRGGQALYQHFAIALDNQLVNVPAVDFKTSPHGVRTDSHGEISGGYTRQWPKSSAPSFVSDRRP